MAGDGEKVAVLLDPGGEVVFGEDGEVDALGCCGADKGLCFGKVCLWVEGLRVEVSEDGCLRGRLFAREVVANGFEGRGV